ncbi:MAG TPA: hypothetical protein VHL79_04590 [Ramlibacter sp.]|jgi:hypothetical protein|nr:hypothetical protein [Ramlibacter sp.]
MFRHWYARPGKSSAAGTAAAPPLPDADAGDIRQYRDRSETLRAAFAEVLALTGIPPAWVSLVAQRAALPDGGHGIHARMILRHWDARLFQGAPQLERLLALRAQALDANHRLWLHGISWSFALSDQDEAAIPPLPAASAWVPQARGRRADAWQKTVAVDPRRVK